MRRRKYKINKKIGRLGSWESERGVGAYFRGWLGDEETDGDEITGGGVVSYDAFMQTHDIGPEAQQEDFLRGEISMDRLNSSSGAAHFKRLMPAQFIAEHPYLKRFMKKPLY